MSQSGVGACNADLVATVGGMRCLIAYRTNWRWTPDSIDMAALTPETLVMAFYSMTVRARFMTGGISGTVVAHLMRLSVMTGHVRTRSGRNRHGHSRTEW